MFPAVVQEMKQERIAFEVCPISNKVYSMPNAPFSITPIPITISSGTTIFISIVSIHHQSHHNLTHRSSSSYARPSPFQVLRLVEDLRVHPAMALLRAGSFITLNNDDPQMFGSVAMSHDYWLATVAWNLDLRGLKTLVRRFSCCHNGAQYLFYSISIGVQFD